MTVKAQPSSDLALAICKALGIDPGIVVDMDLRLRANHVPELFLNIVAIDDGIRELDWGALFKANGFEVNIHIEE